MIIDPPIPPELQLPAPISGRRDEDDTPKSDAFVTIDPPIPPELQLPTPISDRTDELPEGDVYQGSIVDPITITLDPDESHSPPQPPDRSESALPPMPPPIPPLPVGYKTTTVKQLEKKHKHIQKEIAAQLKELEILKNQKAHIEVCLDYFETDEQDFMCTLQGPCTPPEEEETASPGAKSESPPPTPPRPSFLEHLGMTLGCFAHRRYRSRSDRTHRNRPIPGGYSGSTRQSEDDPLPEPFTLFGGGGTRSRSSPPD